MNNYGPLAQYNSLTDPNLQGFFSKATIRQHLVKSGLINKKGSVIPDTIYRYRTAQKEHKKVYRQMLATAIVQEALDLERQRQAQIRDELETIAKIELVRRMRGLSIHHEIPTLWPSSKRLPALRHPIAPVEAKSLDNGDNDIGFVSESEVAIDSKYPPRPPKKKQQQQQGQKRFNRHLRPQSNRRAVSLSPSKRKALIIKETAKPCEITMFYHGRGVNLETDPYIFETAEQVIVYQQHCGGENLIVFKGKVEPNTTFTFESKRHKDYPFSLSVYVDNTYDSRISTCCEYRHKLNHRIGGKKGRFSFYHVNGARPCYKCLLEKRQKESVLNKTEDDVRDESFNDQLPPPPPPPPPVLSAHKNNAKFHMNADKTKIPIKHEEDFTQREKEEQEYDLEFDDEQSDLNERIESPQPIQQQHNSSMIKRKSSTTSSSTSTTNTKDTSGNASAVRKTSVSSNSSNGSEDIFTRGGETYTWVLKFHTIDRQKKANSKKQVDETVSFQIIGDYGESQPIKLKNKGFKLFQAGQIDSFDIKTKNIGEPKYVIVSVNGTHTSPKWHLEKVELIDSQRNQLYLFQHNQVVSNNRFTIINLTKKEVEQTEIPDDVSDDENEINSEHSSSIVERILESDIKSKNNTKSNNNTIEDNKSLDDGVTQVKWVVDFYTSKLSSKVNADIFLRLQGANGSSSKKWFKINKDFNSKYFAPGTRRSFEITSHSVGDLQQLKIGYNCANTDQIIDWHVDKIELWNLQTNDWFLFETKRWLSSVKDEAKTNEVQLDFSKQEKKDIKASVIEEEEENYVSASLRSISSVHSEKNSKRSLSKESDEEKILSDSEQSNKTINNSSTTLNENQEPKKIESIEKSSTPINEVPSETPHQHLTVPQHFIIPQVLIQTVSTDDNITTSSAVTATDENLNQNECSIITSASDHSDVHQSTARDENQLTNIRNEVNIEQEETDDLPVVNDDNEDDVKNQMFS